MTKKFACDIFTPESANVIIFGVPLGSDSAQGIESVRDASWFVESFDIDKKINLLENVKLADIGNLDFKNLEDITRQVKEIMEKNKIPIILGGGHLLSLYSTQALEKNAKLIVFDAHSDLADKYEDEKLVKLYQSWFDSRYNGATWLRRYCETKNPENVCIIGLRSCDEDIMKFIEENNILYFTPGQIRENIEKVKQKLKEFTKNSNLYISVDIDVFDPSIAPVTDYPEPDGIFFNDFRQLVNSIEGRISALDVIGLQEVKNNEAFEFLVVKVIFELLGLLSK